MSHSLTPTRVAFRPGQPLRTRDLTDDQAYFLQQRRRHNLALHTWGIVVGLGLTGGEREVVVSPGMAIDGYGRELVLPGRTRVPGRPADGGKAVLGLPENGENDPGPFDVWLVFALMLVPDRDGGADRLSEEPELLLTRRTERQSDDPRVPPGVPVGDLDFTPDRPLPDDTGKRWPVFLGEVEFREEPPAPGDAAAGQEPGQRKKKWVVRSDRRPAAGLRAERIWSRSPTDAEHDGEVLVSTIHTGPAKDGYPFAVFVHDPAEPAADAPGDAGAPVLAARKDHIALRADRVSVSGNLVMLAGAAVEFKPVPNPTTARDPDAPWQLYHHYKVNTKVDGKDGLTAEYIDEVRITLPPHDARQPAKVVFGTVADKGFTPILSIGSDKRVVVNGDLVVNGRVQATAFKAPDGVGIGTGSDDETIGQIHAFVKANKATRVDRVFKALQEASDPGQVVTIESDPGGKLWPNIATATWKNEKLVAFQGQAATATHLPKFLDELAPGAAPNEPIKTLSNWLFTLADDAKCEAIVKGMPTDSAKYIGLATQLVKKEHRPQLQALIVALIEASGTGDAKGRDLTSAFFLEHDGKGNPTGVRVDGVNATVALWQKEVADLDGDWFFVTASSCEKLLTKAAKTEVVDTGGNKVMLSEVLSVLMPQP